VSVGPAERLLRRCIRRTRASEMKANRV